MLLLLLLLLLLWNKLLLHLVAFVHFIRGGSPVRRFHRQFVGEGHLRRSDADGDGQFAFGFAAEDAARGRHVGVVASKGDTNVMFIGGGIVGGVKADPAEVGQICFDPGVRGFAGGTFSAAAVLVEVAADVATWYLELARQGYHDVRVVLADAFAHTQGLVDG